MGNTRRSKKYIWFISSVSAGGGFLFGYDVAVISGIIPVLTGQFSLMPFQLGLLVSCVLWGCALGSAFSGVLMDVYGRKKVLILSAITLFISAVWSASADNTVPLILARTLGGFGCGLASAVCPLYISETAPEKTRGRMVSLYHFSVCTGIVACTIINWGIFSWAARFAGSISLSAYWQRLTVDQYWRAMFLGEALPGALFLFLSFFIPESPRWLVKAGDISEARVVFTDINGEEEAPVILQKVINEINSDAPMNIKILLSARFRKNMVLALLLCIFSEACGISAVMYYGPQILEHSGLSLNSSLGGFFIIALVNMLFNLVAIIFMDRTGRRKMLAIGTTGSMTALLITGTLFLKGQSGLFIALAMIAFIAFFAFSIGPVKFIVISEIFPNRIRARAVAVATVCIWITSAIIAQLFPIMRESMNTGYIFYIFTLDLVALLAVIKYLMPETKEMSIEDINRDSRAL